MAEDRLPPFVPPMLARRGGPFDSEDHFFEIKWDGVRALCFAEGSTSRLMTRNRQTITAKYPELVSLAGLPDGTIVDGELIVLDGEKPSFHNILRREQAHGESTIIRLSQSMPVAYVVFDILYRGFRSVMNSPLTERRAILAEVIENLHEPRVILSQGIVGQGRAFFQQACDRELEGVVAKKLTSPYLPGKRGDTWTKVKRTIRINCVVIGFIEKDGRDFQSLLVATNDVPGESGKGDLRFVGRVGTGITDTLRDRLNTLLWHRLRAGPLVSCPEKGRWVEPGIYCTVSFNEMTEAGVLRAPVFEELIEG